ncbi:MAG: hypothetical protein EOL98_03555 [Negativicutes bacterium]|nr:hypothetical protein [Negativicutes bacterium]
MKKIVAILSTVMLLVAVVLPINTFALSVSSSVTGPSTVRAGDTITVYFNIGASDITSGKQGLSIISGKVNYDTSKLTYVSSANSVSGWQLTCDGTTFFSEDSDMTHPITSSKSLFSMTFKVATSIATGTSISVSVIDVEATDTGAEAYTSATYSATIAAPVTTTASPTTTASVKTTASSTTTTPKTGNANLGSLEVKNVTLSPAFNPSVTKYTASVDFSVDKLDVSGSTQDSTSTVSMTSKNLAVGTNTIKITVKATGGVTKTYVLYVTRAQDPNAPTTTATTATTAALNKDTKLSGITVDGFVLSPAFDPAVKEYIVWLPYETENLILSGLPASAKSTVTIEGATNLVAGKANDIKIICTAEDGTKETYTLTAMRAPANGVYGSIDSAISDNVKSSGTPIWLTIVLCVVFVLVGFGVSYLIFVKKNENNYDGPDDDYYDGDKKYIDRESQDNYNHSYNEYSSNNNSIKSHFRGISFPGSAVRSYAEDMDYEEENPKVNEAYKVPQKPAYVPQNQGVQAQAYVPPQAPSTPAQAYVPPKAPVTPAQAYVPPRAPATPAQAYVPPKAPATPAQAYVPPKAPATSAQTYASPQYNQPPKDSESLGLPYTPAGVQQTYKAETVENPQPARKIPKNPFEMSADD